MIRVTFLDSGREPQCKPDPKYPEGKDVVLGGTTKENRCCNNLPYPAPRCGIYVVECVECGVRNAITVAGRADDPRTLTMSCGPKKKVH